MPLLYPRSPRFNWAAEKYFFDYPVEGSNLMENMLTKASRLVSAMKTGCYSNYLAYI